MSKKKFKDSVLGRILIKTLVPQIPVVGPILSNALSPADAIDKIIDSPDLSPEDKAMLRVKILELEAQEIERDKIAQQEVTKRWTSDNNAGALTRYVRPSLLIFVTLAMIFFTIIDSAPKYDFEVKGHWVDLWTTLAMTVYGGYFLGKSVEKTFRK